MSTTELLKIGLAIKEKAEEARTKKTIAKELEVKRGFPWWILILVVVVYGVVSYFRGMNPLKWFA